ncbi:MAG: rod-binding protein [Pseudomonadota bacterium]
MDVANQTAASLFAAQSASAPEGALAAQAKRAKTPEEAERIAVEFEAVFVAQMLAPMMSELTSDGPFGGGHGEKMFRTMLTDHYAKEISKSGGFGIADRIKADLLKYQEMTNVAEAPDAAPIEETD